jgi:hypothetical protein
MKKPTDEHRDLHNEGAMTSRITTFSITAFSIESHYAHCRCAERRYVACQHSLYRYAECHYSKCHNSERRSAKCNRS